MKKWVCFLIGFIFTVGLIFSQSIIVTKPDQNSNWEIGQSYLITWTKSGPMQDTVKIDLFKGLNTYVMAINTSTPNDGSYHWQVPQSVTPNHYHIRIRTLNARVSAVSAVFKISAPVISKPDLKVVDAFVEPKPRRVNETITFTPKVQNIGNRKAKACSGKIIITGPQGFQTRTIPMNIPELDPNEWSMLPKFYKLPLHGIYKNTITVDVNNDVHEIYENNNEKVKLYTVDPAPLPDLIVCIRDGGCIELNTTKKVWASVRNIGEAPSSPCKLRFFIEQNDVKIFNVPGLGPGNHKVFYREPIWRTKGWKKMKAIVDYYGVIEEKKENNNSVEGGIMVFVPMLEGCSAGIAGKKCSDSK